MESCPTRVSPKLERTATASILPRAISRVSRTERDVPSLFPADFLPTATSSASLPCLPRVQSSCGKEYGNFRWRSDPSTFHRRLIGVRCAQVENYEPRGRAKYIRKQPRSFGNRRRSPQTRGNLTFQFDAMLLFTLDRVAILLIGVTFTIPVARDRRLMLANWRAERSRARVSPTTVMTTANLRFPVEKSE